VKDDESFIFFFDSNLIECKDDIQLDKDFSSIQMIQRF